MYKSIGKDPDLVYYMSTYGDGQHVSLDWERAEGKTVMLSIHGDKGKGHKVVFLLGLTEMSIPKEQHIYTPNEIISESLLNVGLTRSTKYLFIGFNYKCPSRYLQLHEKDLSKYAYISWESMPEPYKSLIKENNERPVWKNEYMDSKSNTGSKSNLEVRDDLSRDFEHAMQIIEYDWNHSRVKLKFGTRQTIQERLHDDYHTILGKLKFLNLASERK